MLESENIKESSKLLNYLFGGTIRAAAVLSQFLLTLVITRLLTHEESGIFFLALGALTITGSILSFGMEHFLVVRVASQFMKDFTKRLKFFFKFILPVSFIAIFFSMLLIKYHNFLNSKFSSLFHIEVMNIVYALGAFSGITILCGCINGYGRVNVSIILSKAFIPIILVVLLSIMDINDLNSITSLYSIITWITFGVACIFFLKLNYSKNLRNIGGSSKKPVTEMLDIFGVATLTIIGITAQFLIWSGPLCAALFFSTSDVTTIHVVQRSVLVITFALITINALDAPKFARAYSKNDDEYLKKRANFSAKISAILGIFIGILVIIFAQDILLLFGDDFQKYEVLVLILATAQIISCICGPVNILLMMTGNRNFAAFSGLVSLGLILSLSFFLTPYMGLEAVVIAMAFGVVVRNLLDTFFVKKKLGFYVYSR